MLGMETTWNTVFMNLTHSYFICLYFSAWVHARARGEAKGERERTLNRPHAQCRAQHDTYDLSWNQEFQPTEPPRRPSFTFMYKTAIVEEEQRIAQKLLQIEDRGFFPLYSYTQVHGHMLTQNTNVASVEPGIVMQMEMIFSNPAFKY